MRLRKTLFLPNRSSQIPVHHVLKPPRLCGTFQRGNLKRAEAAGGLGVKQAMAKNLDVIVKDEDGNRRLFEHRPGQAPVASRMCYYRFGV